MISDLEHTLGMRDAVRSFCAASKRLYPGYNWISVRHLLEAAWDRRHSQDLWSWNHVEAEMRRRWDYSPELGGSCAVMLFAHAPREPVRVQRVALAMDPAEGGSPAGAT